MDSAYWVDRMTILERALMTHSDEAVAMIRREYKKVLAQVNADISKWYIRYGTENGVSYAEAKRILSTRELAEFRWTVQEYVKYARLNEISPMWTQELERASIRVHVSRLEALRIQLINSAEKLLSIESSVLPDCLKKTYQEGYYKTLFEINKKFQIKTDFMTLNEKKLEMVLKKPWSSDGIHFSERIWGTQRARLVSTLQNELLHNLVTGDTPQKCIKRISERFDVTMRNAERLVYTESSAISSRAKQDSFKEVGVKRFEVIGTLDLKTCSSCGYLDGEVFPMADFKIGSTAPPFHPNCRCSTAPYVVGNEEGERIAREKGVPGEKWISVPKSMKYPEWFQKHVLGKN